MDNPTVNPGPDTSPAGDAPFELVGPRPPDGDREPAGSRARRSTATPRRRPTRRPRSPTSTPRPATTPRRTTRRPPPSWPRTRPRRILRPRAGSRPPTIIATSQGGSSSRPSGSAEEFLRRRPDPDQPGGWIWNLDGIALVPYRLPELIAAGPARRVYVPKRGRRTASAWRGSALSPPPIPWERKNGRTTSHHLRGHDVVVLVNNDDIGRRHGRQVVASLAGVAAVVKVLELPGLPPKGDVSGWLDAGGTVAELERLADEAPPVEPEASPRSPSTRRPSNTTGRPSWRPPGRTSPHWPSSSA